MALSPGARLGPYEILGPVGAGGMGEVYRAKDTRLERDVALKVLPAEAVADETARARLVREARLASHLNHPHICTIYEVGEAGGQTYIAMELVEGQALSARVAEGPLPIEHVLRYGQQLAEALGHAHAHGIVHRDLKSANVVITPEGRAKVLDFGLAKQMTGQELAETTIAPASLTAPGVVAGTLAYMAPEQLRGQPADARSDIWALGVVLYEIAAGTRPFQGQTGFELSSAILNQPLPPLPSSVPAPLAGVIDRCLAKEPGARFQRGDEARVALEAVASGQAAAWPTWRVVLRRHHRELVATAGGVLILLAVAGVLFGLDVGGVRSRVTGAVAAPARVIRLAVLPFANLSGDAEQEYLSDGLTQEMITMLGRLHPAALQVIARTSVMRYKKTDKTIAQIGTELNADYILEGSAQREAGRIRISAELIKVLDQTQLWADSYQRELAGILVLQSEVAQKVAGALALRLLPAEQARLANARTVNPEAYDACQKGSYFWQKLTRADLDTAEQYFDLALEKDPGYAPAYAGIAYVWACRQQMRITPPREAGPKAKAAAQQAITLDDSSADAHEALADIKTWTDWDWAGAEPEWRRALELDPNAANAHAYYSHFLVIMGRLDEAQSHMELALKLDPFNALYHALYAMVLQYHRRFDDALAEARASLAMQPDLPLGKTLQQQLLMIKGMRDELLAMQRERITKDPERAAALERGFAEAGYEGAQRRIADVLAARYEKSGRMGAGIIALRYFDGRDYGRAIDWLEKSYDERDPNLPYIGKPLFDPLRTDPRFQALLRRMGLPQ